MPAPFFLPQIAGNSAGSGNSASASINKINFFALAMVPMLVIAPNVANAARADGTTKSGFYISSADHTDSETYVTYPNAQGSMGTYWVWRWAKTYPKYTSYCSASSCTVAYTETITDTVATLIGVNVTGTGSHSDLTAALQGQFQKTWTKSTAYAYGYTTSLKSGENAYAGVINLDKYLPGAAIRGVWKKVSCTVRPREAQRCTFRWNNNVDVGTFIGHVFTQDRTYMCATKTVVTPKTGDTLPSGCSLPAIPY